MLLAEQIACAAHETNRRPWGHADARASARCGLRHEPPLRCHDRAAHSSSSAAALLLFLGDSVMRATFQQLASTVCGIGSSTSHEPSQFQRLLEYSNKRTYHNARGFCYRRDAAGVMRCAAPWVGSGARDDIHFEHMCAATTMAGNGENGSSWTCLGYSWAPMWSDVERQLRRASHVVRNHSTCASQTMWPPRAVMLNAGLHEVMWSGRADSRSIAPSGLFLDVDWQVKWAVEWCLSESVPSLVVQYASKVVRHRLSVWKRRNLSNTAIRDYNRHLKHTLTAAAGMIGSNASSRLCLSTHDAFELSRSLETAGTIHSGDGVHYSQPFGVVSTSLASQLLCSRPLSPACLHAPPPPPSLFSRLFG